MWVEPPPHLRRRYPAVGFFTPHWQAVFEGRRVLLLRGAAAAAGDAPATHDPTVFDRHLRRAAAVLRLRAVNGTRVASTDMFHHYVRLRDGIIEEVERHGVDTVVLSLGGAATVLAAELACRGYHAIDVGQFGGNFSKRG